MNLVQQPSNLETFVCNHLAREERSVMYVFCDNDGTISMTCGQTDCDVTDVQNCKLVCLGHMIEHEAKLHQLDWLPAGFEAFNEPSGGWILTPLSEEEQ